MSLLKKLTIEREGALTKIEIKKAKNNRRRMVRARYLHKSLRKKVCSSDEIRRKMKDILLVLDK